MQAPTPPITAGDSSDRRRDVCLCLLLSLLTLALYWPVKDFEFNNYDDAQYITGNPHVQSGLTAGNVRWAFTTGYASNWHPLTWLSHMLDCQLYGLNPAGPHVTNLFFHLANTLLLFGLLRRMTGAVWRSAFVAALFALHPMHVESVAWVAERKDVLSAFFGLLTLWAWCWYVRTPSPLCYALALLLFALGLMSKPMLVTLPLLMLLLDFWPLRRWQPGAPRSACLPLLKEKIPFLSLALASSLVTFFVQKAGGAVADMQLLSRISVLPTPWSPMCVTSESFSGPTIWPCSIPFPGICHGGRSAGPLSCSPRSASLPCALRPDVHILSWVGFGL